MAARTLIWWNNAGTMADKRAEWDLDPISGEFTRAEPGHTCTVPDGYGANWWITEDGAWHGWNGTIANTGDGIPWADAAQTTRATPTTHPVDGDTIVQCGMTTNFGNYDFNGPETAPETVLTLAGYDASQWCQGCYGTAVDGKWGTLIDGFRAGNAMLALSAGAVLSLPADNVSQRRNQVEWNGDASVAAGPVTAYIVGTNFGKFPPGSTLVGTSATSLFCGSLAGGTISGTLSVLNTESAGLPQGVLSGSIVWNSTGSLGVYVDALSSMFPAKLSSCVLHVASSQTLEIDRAEGTYGVSATSSTVRFGSPWGRITETLQPDATAVTYYGPSTANSLLAGQVTIKKNPWDKVILHGGV